MSIVFNFFVLIHKKKQYSQLIIFRNDLFVKNSAYVLASFAINVIIIEKKFILKEIFK